MKEDLIVFYDSWCPLCQKARQNIEKWDQHKLVHFTSFRDDGVIERYGLGGKDVVEQIYSMEPKTSKVYAGIETILQIARRVPRYRMLAPILHLFIKLRVGHIVYRWIAKNRNVVPVGKCDDKGCPVHHKEK
ncbi:thiol-disulfide oxidoreductase DCC family protein [Salirhabdus salicampi]|uniref:thiol-disulfide oxidoreductase DCC family protein n=1 Tax=Salirhabdus salicampi TaxID=476102 RepID=UPI0020C586D4|nr:DUF393 domain-containing protein [Salirhabdus salicampi]MCP8616445.1 DUF393 domain-containing protein [Salirhabdus salicampi]